LPLQPVVGEACLVRDPLLVDLLVQARQNSHYLFGRERSVSIVRTGSQRVPKVLASAPRVLTTMLLPTASRTSMLSMPLSSLSSKGRAGRRKVGRAATYGPGDLPGPCRERVRLGRESANGAQVNDVPRHLTVKHSVDVRANLGVAAPPDRAECLTMPTQVTSQLSCTRTRAVAANLRQRRRPQWQTGHIECNGCSAS
jgi:hypothetical protein